MDDIIDNVIALYSYNIKDNTNKILDELVNKLNDDIKNDISKKIRDSANYDYSNINITFDKVYANDDSGFSRKNWQVCDDYFNGKNFIDNEKICIYYVHNSNSYSHGYSTKINKYYYITNYGRVLAIQRTDSSGQYTHQSRIGINGNHSFNIWLPLDYIELITMTKPENIYEILEKISNDLCVRSHSNYDDTQQKLAVENTKLKENVDKLNKELIKINVKYNKLEELYTSQNDKYEKIKNIINDKK